MKPLNVVEYIRPSFVTGSIRLMGNALPFQLTEETLTRSVVAAMTDGTHAADERVATQKALVVSTGELAAAIRMQDHCPVTLALPDRHLHRSNHHLPILAVMHRPADHQFAVQVEHHAQEQFAFQCGYFRDVRDPLALRLLRGEVALQQVFHACWTATGDSSKATSL